VAGVAHTRVLTLGALQCHAGPVELTELPAQRLRCAVLLYIALEREVTREAAASLLWPERDNERSRHALSQKLYELRQLLGRDWLETQGERLCLSSSVQVDAHAFERAVAAGELEQAMVLYRGEFLADFYLPESKAFESWVDRHRSRLARLHRAARRERIAQCLGSRDLALAVAHARSWVEIEPLEDEAQHRLIELLAVSGARAEALRQYEIYERALQGDGLQPLDETRELVARLRRGGGSVDGRGSPLPSAPAAHERLAPQRFTPLATQPTSYGRGVVWGTVAAVLLMTALGWWTTRQDARAASLTRSIAVLPFRNLSPNPQASDYLADGIAEELISALNETDSLRVLARTSSFRFRSRDIAVDAIGDSLGVSLVLDGSVRKEGDRLRVAAQLIDVTDGYHVWSGTYDHQLTDVLSVQAQIANAIVDALRIRLVRPEPPGLAGGGTTDGEAYDRFLKGRHVMHQGTRPAVRTAIAYFDSAVALDPAYALAWAKLADSYVMAASNRELPYAESLASAKAAAQKAIELDPTLSDAHAALARTELELWSWSAAEREARLAIELDANSAAAHAIHASVLLVRGRTREAVSEAALAVRLEPMSATALNGYAEALRADRKYEMAAQSYRAALELEPGLGRQNLAKVYVELAMYDSAMAQFRSAVEAGAPRVSNVDLVWTAYAHALGGRREEATRFLRQFEERQPQGPNAYMIAAVYLALGDEARAFQLMEPGVRERGQRAWRQLPWDPVWDPVRSDPRFQRLLAMMGL
jgi:adenylate cyclase